MGSRLCHLGLELAEDDIMNNGERKEVKSKVSLEKNYTVENITEEHIRILSSL